MEDTRRGIILPERHIALPTTDVISYAFAEYGAYDVDKPIYVDANDASSFITARAARSKVRQLIGGLRAHGLEAGDCVSLHAYNNVHDARPHAPRPWCDIADAKSVDLQIFYPIVWLATIGAGGCISGSNPANTISELTHHLKITETKFIISQKDCFATIAQAARECRIPCSKIFILAPLDARLPDGYLSYETLLGYGEEDWQRFGQDKKRADNTIAVLGATSGTTGLPKSAELSHQYFIAQNGMIQEHTRDRAQEVSQIVCLPVFHAFAAQIALVMPLRRGFTTYFLQRFNLIEFADRIHQYSITDTVVVPPIITALLKLEYTQHYLLKSLRYVVCSGAPMDAHVQAKLYDQLAPEAVVTQCWGTTETGWNTLFSPQEKDTSGSVGRLLPNVELKIVHKDGYPVTQDDVHGEGLIRSPSLFNRYLQNLAATESAFDSDGFFRTGDSIFMRSGKVFLDGRIKDIMKVKGWQVSPAELEAVLLQHSQILDAAVVGLVRRIDDGIEETLPRAFIVRRPALTRKPMQSSDYTTPPQSLDLPATSLLTEGEVQAWVSSRVISYKKLTGGVEFVDNIPRSATGKILRWALTDSRSPPTASASANSTEYFPDSP